MNEGKGRGDWLEKKGEMRGGGRMRERGGMTDGR